MYRKHIASVIVLALGVSSFAVAQSYPSKAVKVVVPFSPGGATDILGRLVSGKLHERTDAPFVVENRAGGGGHIGAEYVVRSTPDGYTLLVAGVPQAIGMSMVKKVRYDMASDLAPVSLVATFPSVIAVHPSLPVKSIRDLISLAKRRPGELNFGANPTSPNRMIVELLKIDAGIDMVLIGYKGTGPVLTDLIGGQIQLASLGLPPAMAHVKSGRLRPIAVSSMKRTSLLPKVPTVDESGVKGFNVSSWYGIFGPAGLPEPIVKQLNGEIRALLNDSAVVKRLESLGADPEPTTPQEFGKMIRSEITRWAKVVKASGATVN